MCGGGGNLDGSGVAETGITRQHPVLKSTENQNEMSSAKTISASRKDPQSPIRVG